VVVVIVVVGGWASITAPPIPPRLPFPVPSNTHLLAPVERHGKEENQRHALSMVMTPTTPTTLAPGVVGVDPQGRQRPEAAPEEFGHEGEIRDPDDGFVREEGAGGEAQVGRGEEDFGPLLPVSGWVGGWVSSGLVGKGGWIWCVYPDSGA
jgi:hypothetical protein